MQVFLQNICLRPSCYSCRFKTISRNSDFTLADFWGVERILEGYNDNKGTSLVLTHTKKAENILIQLKENMMISSIDTKKALALNPSMSESVEVNRLRNLFIKTCDKHSFEKAFIKYCSAKYSAKVRRHIADIVNKIIKRLTRKT